MNVITVHDKVFEAYISKSEIAERIEVLGKEITETYRTKNPILLVVLNGAFMFASDLVKHLDFDCEVHFIKLSSYDGMESTGNIKTVIGLNENIENRPIIIVEDIVDTGKTLFALVPELKKMRPKSVAICTLLQKTEALTVDLKADYIGFEIENKFVVGYGLDYDNLGRNYPMIYQLKTT
ncbi:MAG: hypoxanthine phosphoribosyltransferase [Saprospiraceae bacterium]